MIYFKPNLRRCLWNHWNETKWDLLLLKHIVKQIHLIYYEKMIPKDHSNSSFEQGQVLNSFKWKLIQVHLSVYISGFYFIIILWYLNFGEISLLRFLRFLRSLSVKVFLQVCKWNSGIGCFWASFSLLSCVCNVSPSCRSVQMSHEMLICFVLLSYSNVFSLEDADKHIGRRGILLFDKDSLIFIKQYSCCYGYRL